MSNIRGKLTTLEKRMALWVVAPPPPDEPDDEHWWRGDPRYERFRAGLHALLRYAKARADAGDPAMAAFVHMCRQPARSNFYPGLDSNEPAARPLLAACAGEKQLPVGLLLEVFMPMAELEGRRDAAESLEAGRGLLPCGRALQNLEVLLAAGWGSVLAVDPVAYRAGILAGHPILEAAA